MANVPKEYFVQVPGVYTDPKSLGAATAGTFIDRQDALLLEVLVANTQTRSCDLATVQDIVTGLVSKMSTPLLILPSHSQVGEAYA